MKKVNLTKILSTILILAVTCTIPGQAVFAKSAVSAKNNAISTVTYDNKKVTIEVLNDTTKFKEVKVTSGTDVSTVKYDKLSGSTDLNTNNKSIKINNTVSTANALAKINSLKQSSTMSASLTRYDYGIDLSGNYYYGAYTNGSWFITVPNKTKSLYETSANSSNLGYFRSNVNNLTAKEIEIAGSFGTGTLAVIIACLSAAPETLGTSAIIAICVAAGAGITAAILGVQYYFIAKDCKYYFNRV